MPHRNRRRPSRQHPKPAHRPDHPTRLRQALLHAASCAAAGALAEGLVRTLLTLAHLG